MSASFLPLPLTTIFAPDGTVIVTVVRRTSFVPPLTWTVTVPAVGLTAVTVPDAANFTGRGALTGFFVLFPGLSVPPLVPPLCPAAADTPAGAAVDLDAAVATPEAAG